MTPLQQAAQAMIDHWESTDWKDTPHTAHYVAELRKALDAEMAQSVEPVAWTTRRFDDIMSRERYAEHKRLDTYTHRSGDFDTPLYLHPPRPQATHDLLAAFEFVMDRLVDKHENDPAAIAARAVIAKARGEKP